jgi:hypothetical protein
VFLLFLELHLFAAALEIGAVIPAGFPAVISTVFAFLVYLDLEAAVLAPPDLSKHHIMTMRHSLSSFWLIGEILA